MTAIDTALLTLTLVGCSVIVCTRNRPEMLAEAIAAIRPTMRAEDELIVVDSASEPPVAPQPDALVVRSDVKGLSIARNVGVGHASKPIVVFTDDDCRPQTGWLDVIEAAFDAPDIGFVIGQVRADVEGAYLPFDAVPRPPRTFVGVTDPIDLGHGACMAFNRDAYVGCGGADDRMGAGSRLLSAEDHDLFLRLLVTGWKGKYEPAALVLHRDWRTHREVVQYCWGVGLGTGAMVGKMTRVAGFKVTGPLLKRRLGSDGVAEIATGLRKRSKSMVAASTLKLTGTLTGFVLGVAFRRQGSRFRPAPAPARQPGGRSGP
jgi:glycosyltransferase involved in cell wall biosynthesis